MRAVPARESIGRKALMDHGEPAGKERVPQLREKPRNLMRDELALVHHGQRGKRAEVEQLGRVKTQRVDRVECPFADDVELALERLEVVNAGATRDKDLANGRHAAPG